MQHWWKGGRRTKAIDDTDHRSSFVRSSSPLPSSSLNNAYLSSFAVMSSVKLLDPSEAKLGNLGNGALLGDIDASLDNQLAGGIYEQSHSEEPLSYTYTYDEMKVVLEGELHIKDTKSGEELVAKPGQVLNIANGAALQFNSPTKARVFYVAKRGRLP